MLMGFLAGVFVGAVFGVLLMALVMLFCGIYIIAVPGIIVATIGVLMIIYGVMDFIEEIIFRINEKDLMKE